MAYFLLFERMHFWLCSVLIINHALLFSERVTSCESAIRKRHFFSPIIRHKSADFHTMYRFQLFFVMLLFQTYFSSWNFFPKDCSAKYAADLKKYFIKENVLSCCCSSHKHYKIRGSLLWLANAAPLFCLSCFFYMFLLAAINIIVLFFFINLTFIRKVGKIWIL